eukprot:1142640-Pelagomonas_calceolata.AAC.16
MFGRGKAREAQKTLGQPLPSGGGCWCSACCWIATATDIQICAEKRRARSATWALRSLVERHAAALIPMTATTAAAKPHAASALRAHPPFWGAPGLGCRRARDQMDEPGRTVRGFQGKTRVWGGGRGDEGFRNASGGEGVGSRVCRYSLRDAPLSSSTKWQMSIEVFFCLQMLNR